MATSKAGLQQQKVVSHDEWIAARKEYLLKEKEFSRQRDELSRLRRELPMEKVEKRLCLRRPERKRNARGSF